MLQKYRQVPATLGITNINYKKSTHTTKDLQTREALTGKKTTTKKTYYHKLNSFFTVGRLPQCSKEWGVSLERCDPKFSVFNFNSVG